MTHQPEGRSFRIADQAAPIRLMIVDDSIVARTILSRVIGAQPGFQVAAVVGSADQALAALQDHPVDIILLDIQMPGVDGLTALPALIERSGGAKVLIVSSSCADGAAASVRAMTLGAADTLLKPAAGSLAGQFEDTLIERLTRIGQGRRGSRAVAGALRRPRAYPGEPEPVTCLAIGASTGGPHALAALLKGLPAAFPAPILITQHLPASFIPYFADQLRDITGRPSTVAGEGMLLRPGEIFLAPGDAHMRVAGRAGRTCVVLDRAPVASGCLPSVDPMMASVGETFGNGAVAVMLTGMGRDGVVGATALAAAGGQIFAQDAESSVIWGMPGAVAEAGIACALLPPERIARRIAARVEKSAWK